MSDISDAEMFAHCEQERSLASHMTDAELAKFLLEEILSAVRAAEQEFAVTDQDYEVGRLERGAVREAAYRLAKLRDYERR